MESKGYFNPDNQNNHTIRKWNSYYDFSKHNKVDILLVGNSHLYTGINPKNLSAALGCNAFILASPGTQLDDHYFAIKEAIKVNKPKLLVLETYGLKKLEPTEKKEGELSDQFKSFAARKDFWIKLKSTPNLFSISNYPYAWSNTLRNHSFLLNDYEQIEENIKDKNKYQNSTKELYLGRYVRFQTGIEDSTLQKYEELGAPVNGEKYETNTLQEQYISDVIELCDSNDIEIVFVTVPMFEKHINKYYSWKNKLATSFGDKYALDEYWLDMQDSINYKGFTKHSFENTYSSNQHLTYPGSLIATYKLIEFIENKERIILPDRRNDEEWINLFYTEEGFLENNSPKENDKKNKVLFSSDKNEGIKEILMLEKEKFNTVLLKFRPNSPEQFDQIKANKIRLTVLLKTEKGQTRSAYIDLTFDKLHSTKSKMNYLQNIKPVEILKISNIQFVK